MAALDRVLDPSTHPTVHRTTGAHFLIACLSRQNPSRAAQRNITFSKG